MPERFSNGTESWEAEARIGRARRATVLLEGERYDLTEVALEDGVLSFSVGGRSYRMSALALAGRLEISDGTYYLRAHLLDLEEQDGQEHRGAAGSLHSQMPGRVLAHVVAPGTLVSKGQPLLILEAMKMEHEILAPADGMVLSYPLAQGSRVMPGDLLVEFKPSE